MSRTDDILDGLREPIWKPLAGYCQPDTINCPRKKPFDQLQTEIETLKKTNSCPLIKECEQLKKDKIYLKTIIENLKEEIREMLANIKDTK